jgi:branched-chain amino acid transport system ATP-binding protein
VTELLGVEGVTKRFGGVQAVDGASLAVERGAMTALIGPNGAGKSTLFSVVSGFVRPDAGSVRFDGQDISGWSPYRIARRGLARTFQLTRTFAGMSVLDNMLVAHLHHRGSTLTGALLRHPGRRADERAARARAEELLSLFSLDGHARRLAAELSGGQRKLLELARVLMLEPSMVLLDEPMAGVNRTLGETLLDHIRALRERTGTTFLFVEHDMDVVARHADRVIVMADGRVVVTGSPEAVMRDKRVIEAYLGTSDD